MKAGKRWLSLGLVCLMCLSMLPIGVVASDGPEEAVEPSAVEVEEEEIAVSEKAAEPEKDTVPEAALEEETVEVVVEAGAEEPYADEAWEQTYTYTNETVVVSGNDQQTDNDDLFYGYMTSLVEVEPDVEMLTQDGAAMTDMETTVYGLLESYIRQVAAGERASTAFTVTMEQLGLTGTYTAAELGVRAIVIDGAITQDAANAAYGLIMTDMNIGAMEETLLLTMPYDLYWYDKTAGSSYSYPNLSATYTDGEWELSFQGDMVISFAVAQEYAAGEYTVDTTLGQSAQQAAARAKKIVEDYAPYQDYDKLVAYREKICQLTAYNSEAASDNDRAYGNPWQLVWVFDDDSATTVVCEGYAKAFQYLCDLSTFQEDISCITVTGTIDGGPHMWNVVNMEDGKNYLVDVTNCDTGTVGAPDLLFLAGGMEQAESLRYVYDCDWSSVTYIYDEQSRNVFEASQLIMSSEAYGSSTAGAYSYTQDGVVYSIAKGRATVTGHTEDVPADLVIPETVDGAIVVAIGNDAFYFCQTLHSVTLPATVRRLEDGYVEYAWGEVTSAGTVPIWAHGSFSRCENLEAVIIPEDSKLYYVGSYAFSDDTALDTVVLPASIRTLGLAAFQGCSSLSELVLPYGLERIEQNALSETGITELVLPSTCNFVHYINNMTSLETISVAEDNPVFRAEDNVLYKYENREWVLLLYPGQKKDEVFTVADFASAVEASTFFEHPYVKTVNLGTCEAYEIRLITCDIDVSTDNPYYIKKDGLIYDATGQTLVRVPAYLEGTVEVAEGTVAVDSYACYLSKFSQIVLPDTLTTIRDAAFFMRKE